ncbi:MAG: glycosyltransferase [Victivallales bacterium]|nr:glycosyltransferase [Victivallales bacterium]
MRILFLIVDLNSGGAEWQLASLAESLTTSGVELKVVCMNGRGAVWEWLTAAGIDVECLNYEKPRQLTRLARFAGIVNHFKPDILHTWMFHANFAGKVIGRLAGIKNIVVSLRVAEKERRHHILLDKVTAGLARKILCNSKGLAEFAANHGTQREKIVVIQNSFDASLFDFHPFEPPQDSKWRLLFIGRISRQKGLPYLLEALAELKCGGYDFHLDLVGAAPDQGELQALKEMAERLELDGGVTFSPPLAHEKVPSLMQERHLLVLPSLWEGMPNVVMEAFGSGLPVVATNIEGTNELVADGETGLLAKPADSSSLAAKIAEAFENPARLADMAKNANAFVRREHDPKTINKRYLDFYLEQIRADAKA